MAEEDTVQTVAAEVCQFPGGCTNVLPPKSGRRGAPRLYCGLPVDGRVHNPQNALAVQRRRDEEDAAVMRRGGLAAEARAGQAVAEQQARAEIARAEATRTIAQAAVAATEDAEATRDAALAEAAAATRALQGEQTAHADAREPVSYTHLKLPT